MKFKELGLDKDVLRSIDQMGFESPTKIQQEIIPYILEGRDVVGRSETGTGKTLAFAAGMLSKLSNNNFVKTLVLAPTRELAIQVGEEIESICKFTNYSVLTVYGNSNIENQIKTLKKGVDIVVGTPGRVSDLIRRRKLNLENLEFFVLDEADEMLNMGFREDIEDIYKRTKRDKQVLLFSATMPKGILDLSKKFMKNDYKEISVVSKVKTAKNIVQKYYLVNTKTRTESMCRVMDKINPSKAMVFCKTKRNVDQLNTELAERGYSVGIIHGDVAQRERISTLDKFKKGVFNYLIATDVAARGIHVDDVDAVFNYNLPQDNESYVHRIGRTGRANKSGIALSFVTPSEERVMRSIERHIKTNIEIDDLPSLEDIIPSRCEKIIENISNLEVVGDDFNDYLESLKKDELKEICNKLLSRELINKLGSDFDVNVAISKKKKTKEKGRNRKSNGNETRIFLTIGSMDKVNKKELLSFLEKKAGIPVGTITSTEIMPKFTFCSVKNKHLDIVMKKCNNVKYNGRVIRVEKAKS